MREGEEPQARLDRDPGQDRVVPYVFAHAGLTSGRAAAEPAAVWARPGAFTLAHNVATQSDVQPLLDRLAAHGGKMLRIADAPPHGGFRGYVADPDGHAWEIAWNPAFPMDDRGNVTFGS